MKMLGIQDAIIRCRGTDEQGDRSDCGIFPALLAMDILEPHPQNRTIRLRDQLYFQARQATPRGELHGRGPPSGQEQSETYHKGAGKGGREYERQPELALQNSLDRPVSRQDILDISLALEPASVILAKLGEDPTALDITQARHTFNTLGMLDRYVKIVPQF